MCVSGVLFEGMDNRIITDLHSSMRHQMPVKNVSYFPSFVYFTGCLYVCLLVCCFVCWWVFLFFFFFYLGCVHTLMTSSAVQAITGVEKREGMP